MPPNASSISSNTHDVQLVPNKYFLNEIINGQKVTQLGVIKRKHILSKTCSRKVA